MKTIFEFSILNFLRKDSKHISDLILITTQNSKQPLIVCMQNSSLEFYFQFFHWKTFQTQTSVVFTHQCSQKKLKIKFLHFTNFIPKSLLQNVHCKTKCHQNCTCSSTYIILFQRHQSQRKDNRSNIGTRDFLTSRFLSTGSFTLKNFPCCLSKLARSYSVSCSMQKILDFRL